MIAQPLNAKGGSGRANADETFVAHSLRADGFDASEDGTGRGTPIVPTLAGNGDSNSGFRNEHGLVVASVTSKWAKGSGGPAGDECQNLIAQGGSFDEVNPTHEIVGPLCADGPTDKKHGSGGLTSIQHMLSGYIQPTVTHSLRADGFDASEDGTGRGTSVIPILEAGARTGKSTEDTRAGSGIGESGDPMFTLQNGKQHAVAFAQNTRDEVREMEVVGALAAEPGMKQQSYIAQVQWASGGGEVENPTAQALRSGAEHNYQFMRTGMQVRRLTPRECERLQGFPDNYTLITYRGKPAADGPRYRALGNSFAVPVVRWIGERIQAVEDLGVE